MRSRSSLAHGITTFLLILAVSFLAIYFRTYVIHGGPRFQISALSENVGRFFKTRPVSRAAEDSKSGSPGEKPAQKSDAPANGIVQVITPSDQPHGMWRLKYLLELDPYHYLWQTEQVLKTGRSGPEIKSGKVLNPLGRAPYGIWEPFLIHPYLGAYFYKFLRLFFSDIKVLEAVAYFPLLIVILVPFVYFIFARIAGFDLLATFYGMTTMALAPFIIFRTMYGWFDTDAYSLILPLGILSFILFALKRERYFIPCAAGAALMTSVYAVCWPGWFYLPVLITGSMIAALLVLFCADRFRRPPMTGAVLKVLCGYWVGILLFLILFMGFEGFLGSCRLAGAVFLKFIAVHRDVWPDVFSTVGEAQSFNFPEMIMSGSTFTTLGLALFGIGLELHRAYKNRDRKALFLALFFALFSIPLLVLSLHARRFTELFVLPLAILASFGILNLRRLMESEKIKSGPDGKGMGSGRGSQIAWVLILFFAFGKQLASAHEAAIWNPVFMTPSMESVCNHLKEKSPSNAIVNAWWDPGYVLNQIADRRVLVDGGTQDSRVLYWFSSALLAEDEKLASGILRMINTSRNDAFDFLETLGMKTADGVALIRKIVPLSRKEAFRALPPFMADAQKNAFLDKTHGASPLVPVYLLIDQTLMRSSSLAVSFARWDFTKAESLLRRSKEDYWKRFGDPALAAAMKDFFDHSQKVMPCYVELPLVKTDRDHLIFQGDLGVDVNWNEKDAMLTDAAGKPIGRPRSLFFLDGTGHLNEKTLDEDSPDASVLVVGEEGGVCYAVLAETPLIRSMLFRFYFLNGAGLTFFKPVIREGLVERGSCIKVFELDRAKLQN